MIYGRVQANPGAFTPDCPHCRAHGDGGGCAFHSARAEHEQGRCSGAQGNPSGCFFCPEPGLRRPWMSEAGIPTAPTKIENNHVVLDPRPSPDV